jgi:hypothetical protein
VTTSPSIPPTTTPTPETPSLTDGKSSVLGEAIAKAPAGSEPKAGDAPADGDKPKSAAEPAPTDYGDFTVPEGITLTQESLDTAKGLFKEAGLSKETAQKFMDMHTAAVKAMAEGPANLWKETQETWVEELRSDPVIGKGIDNGQVGGSISKMLSLLPDVESSAMREAFNFTGAGNHPAIVRGLYQLSKLLTEPGHVQGRPAPQAKERPSGAHAIYPNLVKKD